MLITINDDFSLEKIAASGQCFRARLLADGRTRFITKDFVIYMIQKDRNRYEISCSGAEWESVWRPYFDLDTSYSAIREQIRDDFFRTASEEGAGIRILRQDPWETLISFILSQRKSIPAIQKSIEGLAEAFGHPIETPCETLRAFPSPNELAHLTCRDFASCSLGYRAPYVFDAVQRVLDGSFSPDALCQLDDTELLEQLMTVRGVGIKVSGCVGLFAYGRKSIAPVDTWILKILQREFGGKNPFPTYCETAGILQQYAFYYAQKHKDRYRGM